jgi:hypothetical protein
VKHLTSFALLASVLVLLLATTGCTSNTTPASSNVKLAPTSVLPARMQNAPTTVREAYQFAIANPDLLKQVPCYCGCNAVGHTSNYACYVKEAKPDGTIVFDDHALG